MALAVELQYPQFILRHNESGTDFGPFPYKEGAAIDLAGAALILRTNARENERGTHALGRKVRVKGNLTDAGWQPTGFRVQKGDVLKIRAEGLWKGPRESVTSNADGYVPSITHQHRSVRRKYQQFNYSALLYRIGNSTAPQLVGTGGVATIAKESGILQFDANILDDRQYRNQGDGEITVYIEIVSLEMNHRPALMLMAADDRTKNYGPFAFTNNSAVLVGANQVAFTLRMLD